jgi:hypothetical protein
MTITRRDIIQRLERIEKEARDLRTLVAEAPERENSAPPERRVEYDDEEGPPARGRGFEGIPYDAKYDGDCCVCSAPFYAGEKILWNPDEEDKKKQRAHARCGRARPRRQSA